MKTLTTLLALTLASCALSQTQSLDKTLDINYLATFKNDFSLKWSSRLSESQDWSLHGFTAGGAYNLNRGANKFALTYDLWRGNDCNIPLSKRYGLSYSSQGKFTNLNFSIVQTDAPNQPGGFQGRIDLNMRFK